MHLSQILLGPIVTEKAVRMQEKNQHVFSVHADATKIDVMQAIRTFYGVAPTAVRMLNIGSKTRLLTRTRLMTKRRAMKRAIVVLPAGASLELLNVKKETPAAKSKAKKKSSPSQK